ncbi:MAG TPA: Ni/Fe-hydrogenase cytochrome b subunit [Candidatus Competibacteraceae bacterium]|nr:Ni/Fe-hydrogenase cytochrome b subunit [Candidatus Competibacteraceae bacterium]MCP5132439.1 Ni/Fe-hydrogenase cytochrome b subunit [Gammaproteobacteria bacterium]HPF60167.1 Ni/Fe-hydrogenase cytochrome b subunit [Candidatus Competibacteraceae bacterium]HRY19552.1 Ni/Fe-hydrogenase cytochrome b subunit [Candidatus Competibacteraceae bacterium]
MSETAPRPLGGPIITKPFAILGVFLLIGGYFILRRFLFGMADVSNMSNGYPIGTWVVLDVVIGTAFGCGGFAMALLVYIFNRNVYHPLMRPALLGGVFGYTLAGLAVMIDLGRYWNAFNLLMPWYAQINSVIFEVALCVMAYITVLWIEFWPAFLERMPVAIKQRFNLHKLQVFLRRYMYIFIGLGVLLPTMHQSSLGSVLLIMGSKLSPLWYTQWLPLLYLISALTMGYGVVMLESTLVQRSFKLPSEAALLAKLSRVAAGLLVLFLAVRFGDLLARGQLGRAFAGDRYSVLFLIETALFAAPVLILASRRRCANMRLRFLATISLLAAGSLYRMNGYLLAIDPGNGWTYFPSAPELMITVGVVCLEIMLYLIFVKTLPVLPGSIAEAPGRPS